MKTKLGDESFRFHRFWCFFHDLIIRQKNLNCIYVFRIIHEAFQFLILKKKKLSGRSVTENWGIVGGKAGIMGLINKVEDRDQSDKEEEQ